jgi:cellobiose phosphorylase
VIPAKWEGFTVTRRFRGNTYQIEVKNPNGKQCGVKSLLVDGQKIVGNILLVGASRSEPIRVEAVLEGDPDPRAALSRA